MLCVPNSHPRKIGRSRKGAAGRSTPTSTGSISPSISVASSPGTMSPGRISPGLEIFSKPPGEADSAEILKFIYQNLSLPEESDSSKENNRALGNFGNNYKTYRGRSVGSNNNSTSSTNSCSSVEKKSSIRNKNKWRIVINHENEMPSDYGTTPGGTLFGTTPGGTRIVYERAFLMQMRGSPLARTPPTNLPVIPGVTAPSEPKQGGGKKKDSSSKDGSNNKSNGREASPTKNRVHEVIKEEDDQFAMDM